MKPFQKQEQYRWIVPVLFSIFLALILSAMFSTLGHQNNATGIVAKYVYLPSVYDVTFSQGVRLMVLGIASGLIGGMMGMGGGVVKTSGLMVIFGIEVLMVRTIALITNIFIYGSAAYRYAKKNGLILKKVAELMIPGALIGVALGFIFGNVLNPVWLKRLLGFFALFSGIDMLRRVYFSNAPDDDELPEYGPKVFGKESKIKISGAGLPMGMVMGLFGISGGVIGVPYQRFILKIPLRNAIANTSITSFFASTFAVLLALWYQYNYGYYSISTPITMALWIIPGNIVGAQVGAYLTGFLPLKFIKLFYVFIMIVIGIRLLF